MVIFSLIKNHLNPYFHLSFLSLSSSQLIYIFHFIFMDLNNFLLEIFFMMMTLTMILNYLQQQRLLKKSNKLMRNDFFPSSRETWRLYISYHLYTDWIKGSIFNQNPQTLKTPKNEPLNSHFHWWKILPKSQPILQNWINSFWVGRAFFNLIQNLILYL